MFNKLFTDHPKSVGESYFEHMKVAGSFGSAMFMGSLACFVHAVIPCLFETTGSRKVRALHHRMVTHRTAEAPKAPASAASA